MAFHGTPQEYRNARARVAGGNGSDEDIEAVRRMAKQAGQTEYKEALKSAGLEE